MIKVEVELLTIQEVSLVVFKEAELNEETE